MPVFFYQYIKRLTTIYPEIFDGGAGNSTSVQINHGKKWRGYSSIVELANGDILKFDDIIEQPLEKCLLYLAYKADTALVQELLHKQIMSGMK